MNSFKDIIEYAASFKSKPTLVVACPYDKNILSALSMAKKEKLVEIIAVGDKYRINDILYENNIDLEFKKLIEIDSDVTALTESYSILLSGEADIIMKGIVQTKDFMGVLLSDKSFILRKLLTHVAIYEVPYLKRLLFVSDPSIIIEPSINQKKIIIDNAADLLFNLGIIKPKVALISSTEVPNPKIQSSMDSVELVNMFKNNEKITVDGPLGIDNAISQEASKVKNIKNKVSGQADLLIVPNLDCGNIFCKGLTYIGGIESAGIVMGAKKPIVLTSRSANSTEKLNSIAIACLIVNGQNNNNKEVTI